MTNPKKIKIFYDNFYLSDANLIIPQKWKTPPTKKDKLSGSTSGESR